MPLDDTTKHYEQALAQEADPFTLPALIAWLRTKPSDEEYRWMSFDCCLAQYLRSKGRSPWGKEHAYTKFPAEVRAAIVLSSPHTFGAALARAEALAKSEA